MTRRAIFSIRASRDGLISLCLGRIGLQTNAPSIITLLKKTIRLSGLSFISLAKLLSLQEKGLNLIKSIKITSDFVFALLFMMFFQI